MNGCHNIKLLYCSSCFWGIHDSSYFSSDAASVLYTCGLYLSVFVYDDAHDVRLSASFPLIYKVGGH